MAASWAKKVEELENGFIDIKTYVDWMAKFPEKVPKKDRAIEEID